MEREYWLACEEFVEYEIFYIVVTDIGIVAQPYLEMKGFLLGKCN